MKLELKHLAPYLPYRLKAITTKKTYLQSEEEKVSEMWTLSIEDDSCVLMAKDGYFLCSSDEIMPILHPLSDLTKPITVEGYNEGKEFVPLLELFSMIEETDYIDYLIGREAPKNPEYQIDDGWNHCLTFNEDVEDELTFGFSGHSFWLMIGMDHQHIMNQSELFQLLYQWHFAIDIPEGTWIDINTLNKSK